MKRKSLNILELLATLHLSKRDKQTLLEIFRQLGMELPPLPPPPQDETTSPEEGEEDEGEESEEKEESETKIPFIDKNGNIIFPLNTGVRGETTLDPSEGLLINLIRVMWEEGVQVRVGSTQAGLVLESSVPPVVRLQNDRIRKFVFEDELIKTGYTHQRPTPTVAGYQFFDLTLNKPIWWSMNGYWVDANGEEV